METEVCDPSRVSRATRIPRLHCRQQMYEYRTAVMAEKADAGGRVCRATGGSLCATTAKVALYNGIIMYGGKASKR